MKVQYDKITMINSNLGTYTFSIAEFESTRFSCQGVFLSILLHDPDGHTLVNKRIVYSSRDCAVQELKSIIGDLVLRGWTLVNPSSI